MLERRQDMMPAVVGMVCGCEERRTVDGLVSWSWDAVVVVGVESGWWSGETSRRCAYMEGQVQSLTQDGALE